MFRLFCYYQLNSFFSLEKKVIEADHLKITVFYLVQFEWQLTYWVCKKIINVKCVFDILLQIKYKNKKDPRLYVHSLLLVVLISVT